MIDDILLTAEDHMDKTIAVAAEEFAGIRTGRANPGMFTKLLVDYYGAPTPLQQLASITVPEARTVLITPYDKSAMAAIERVIRDSDLGVNPSDDGTVIRLVMPELTTERRKQYIKLARHKAEEARVAIRATRHKSREALIKLQRDGESGEDDVHRAETELDTLTKKYVAKVDSLLEHKEAELLEV
ncbi:MAG: ribosome recycling factor [Bifidobacteriaceae bacterium]|jgi:ribosome recycling factor|nr:ribosome recycling factor [Bifidobacteriaceae bacterium]